MRVSHTPFNAPVRVIGRDAELTIALIQAMSGRSAPQGGIFHRIIDTFKMLLK